jgi:hypothetical protein
MSRAGTPIRDGFSALVHEPALVAAELTWRWCFGFSALLLGICSGALFLNGLKVSKTDQFLISTLQPQLLAAALQDIFRGSLPQFLLEQALLLLGLTLMWAYAAAAGRAATLNRLLAMFSSSDEPQPAAWHFRPLFLLELLRAMWTQIAIAVTLFLVVYGSNKAANQQPMAAAVALSFGVAFALLVGFSLNWYLGLAPLFCLRNGVHPREAMGEAIDFSAEYGGCLTLIGLAFFVLRLLWLAVMSFIFLAPLKLVGKVNGRWIALLVGLIALVYFAGADVLRLARWGAYISLLEDSSHSTAEPEIEPLPPISPPDLSPLEGLA